MEAALEVIDPRNPEGLGFYLKARVSGRLFRVEPIRDPRQPRFWSICIYHCARPRVADPTDRPWLGQGGLTRDELPVALQTIRADVDAWLAQDSCKELRRWLLTEAPPTVPAALSALQPAKSKAGSGRATGALPPAASLNPPAQASNTTDRR